MSSKKHFRKVALTTMAASAAVVSIAPVASAAETKEFKDVPKGSSHYEGVQWAYSEGIIKGYTEDTFGVGRDLTRSHAAIMFVKALGLEELPAAEVTKYFKDVNEKTPYAGFIAAAGKAGIFAGDAKKNFNINNPLTREQMATVLVKAFELKTNGTPADVNLKNVGPDHKTNVQIIADLGITNQLKDFRPGEAVQRGQFATFLKKTHDVKAATFAATIEHIESVDATTMEVTFDGALTDKEISDLNIKFSPTLEVKKVARKADASAKPAAGEKTTVVLTTGEQKPGTTYKVEAINGAEVTKDIKVEIPATEAKVESVKAINNKEVEVAFNKTLDKETAEAIANYKLTAVTTGGTATIGKAELQKDGKTVVLTLSKEGENQEAYTVGVKGIKDTDGKTVVATEKEFKFFDVTPPTIGDVSLVSPRAVKINFSEPLKNAPTVKLDNGSISTAVALSADGKSATVEFGIEPTSGDHNLEISGGTDFAGLKVEKTTKSFTYQPDASAPIVSVDKIAPKEVTLKFSKPVKVQKASDVSVYHTVNNSGAYAGGSLTPVSADVNGYSDTYTVEFNTPIPEGNAKIFLNTKEKALQDGWGNDVSSTEISTSLSIDKQAPQVTSAKAESDSKLELTFDKKVNKEDAENVANYILKDSAGKVLSNKEYGFVNDKGEFASTVNASYDPNKNKVTIALPNSLKGGNYSLTVKNIKDTTFLENKLTSQDVNINVADTTPWNIVSDAKQTGDKIRITFNEAMSTDGLTSLKNYELRSGVDSVNKVDFPEGTKVVILNSKAVEIQLPSGSNVTTNAVRVSGTLKDAAGNTYTQLFKQVPVTEDRGPEVVADSAKTTATNKVEFKVDQELSGSLDASKFTTADVTYGAASYVNKDGEATITLTVKSGTPGFAPDATPNIDAAAGTLKNAYGAPSSEAVAIVDAADGIAPSVVKTADNTLDITSAPVTGVITINYNEALGTTAQALMATDLKITDKDGTTLQAGVDYTTTTSGTGLTVTRANGYSNYQGKLTISSVENPVYIKDAVGNKANSFATTSVNLDVTPPAAATNVAAPAGLTTITGSVEPGSKVTVYDAAEAGNLVAGSSDVKSNGSFTWTKSATTLTPATKYYVEVTDAAGNKSATRTEITTPAS